MADVDSLSISNTDELGYVGEAIRKVTTALDNKIPLLGFVGAPFTIASYMIEGGALVPTIVAGCIAASPQGAAAEDRLVRQAFIF